MFFKNKRLKEREISALEERNKIEREHIRAEEQRNKLNEQALLLLVSQEEHSNIAEYRLPEIHPSVVPDGQIPAIAMDSCSGIASYANMDPQFASEFLGYPRLSMMSQSSDYRCVSETTSTEMIREWGKVKLKGDSEKDYTDKIAKIEGRLKALNIRALVRKLIEVELIFGRAQLFIDIDGHDNKTDIPLLINENSLKKGCLKGFRVIEPIWSTPAMYNATNPLDEDFFTPSRWFVLGKNVHKDRLMTLIMRPVPDMMKPAYNFSGVSIYQLMMPYVQRWQRTVDSVSELIYTFSTTGIKANMGDILTGGTNDIGSVLLRAQLFSKFKNNQNILMLDTDEEFFQLNTPLSGLDALLQKSQEQMAAPSHTPLVKLLGITPSGLNANSEGEIRVYNDYISSLQEAHIRPIMDKIINLVQIDLFGEIDDQIVFSFNPLEQMNEEQKATIDKTNADRDAVYVQNGILSPEEIRAVIANNDDGDYSGIDVDNVPESPDYGLVDYGQEQETNNHT